MMSSRPNASMIAPTTDVDFGYAPMQSYVGFEPGMAMPNDRQPLLPHHLYDSLDFAAAAFPFQEPSLFSGSPHSTTLQQPMAPQFTMPMAPPNSLQMPMMTLQGVPTAGDVYPFGGGGGGGFVKREDFGPFVDGGGGGGRIGLNLGRRTYFSPSDVLAMDRLLMRSRLSGVGAMGGVLGLGLGAAHHHQPPRCQAEGCKADLSAAKHYHRRHKVCEYHAKAAAVSAAGKQQRFCQQCSRFHVLAEFDEAKRSCRKRLTEHNRRRRKPARAQAKDSPPSTKKAETGITSSYTSDHKTTNRSSTTAISPSAASGFSCCLGELDNSGQTSSAKAAPTTLCLAAPPQSHNTDVDGLDTMLMQEVQHSEEQRFMMTSLVQSHHRNGNNVSCGNILSCSTSVSDQQNGSCNGGSNDNNNGMQMQHFFEVDFM